jgi:hypothetical protein
VTKPQQQAIGRDATGQFKTAAFKEYPAAFSAALAGALADQLEAVTRRKAFRITPLATPETEEWVNEALEACTEIRAHAQFLPDFQE